jgi:hypothetical protein
VVALPRAYIRAASRPEKLFQLLRVTGHPAILAANAESLAGLN